MTATADDRKAAAFVLFLFLAGIVVRAMGVGSGGAPGGVVLLADVDAERAQRDSVKAQAARLAAPLKRGERIDVDVAQELDLTRLPRIGPTLARRIVADRDDNGPFGSLAGLGRVSGIGPRLLEGLDPHVRFSGRPRVTRRADRTGSTVSLNSASAEDLAGLPGIGPSRAAAIIKYREVHGRFSTVDALVEVSGIGPATVDRIRALVRVR